MEQDIKHHTTAISIVLLTVVAITALIITTLEPAELASNNEFTTGTSSVLSAQTGNNTNANFGRTTPLSGRLTQFDLTTSPTSSTIEFSIDNQSVTVDREFALSSSEFDRSLQVGSSVEAVVLIDENGNYTMANCPECYVKAVEN